MTSTSTTKIKQIQLLVIENMLVSRLNLRCRVRLCASLQQQHLQHRSRQYHHQQHDHRDQRQHGKRSSFFVGASIVGGMVGITLAACKGKNEEQQLRFSSSHNFLVAGVSKIPPESSDKGSIVPGIKDVIVVGGGLTGLTAMYRLREFDTMLLEWYESSNC